MEEDPNSELLPKISKERRQLTPQELQWLRENGGKCWILLKKSNNPATRRRNPLFSQNSA